MYACLLSLDSYVYEAGEVNATAKLLDAEDLEIINQFLVRAFAQLERELPEKETIPLIEMYLRNVYFLSKLTPLFQKNNSEINKLIKHRHPNLYTKWLQVLSDDPIRKRFSIEYVEDVAVNLAMFTYSSEYGESGKKKHVLFAFDGKKAYLNYLNVLVNNFVNQNIKITFLVNQHITNKIVQELAVDIVVYNYREDSEALHCSKYKTERMPTERDWQKINSLIFDE